MYNILAFKKHLTFLGLCTLMMVTLFTLNSCDNKEQIVINEFMASNHSTLSSQDGELYDWIELKNVSDKTVALQGYSLVVEKSTNMQDTDNANVKTKTWNLPNIELKAGQCLLIFASKNDKADLKGEIHASFKLPSAGGTIKLMNGNNVISDVTFEELKDDQCYCRQDDGSYAISYECTPGFDNNEKGHEQYCSAVEKQRTGSLRIWELHNKGDKNGEAWVELKNVGDAPINLQDYCLTTSMKDMSQWNFPQVVLQPGEFYVVNGSKDGFKMGKNKSVTLTKNGKFVDGMCAAPAPQGTTAGRKTGNDGIFYFKVPTRGAENTTPSSRTIDSQDDNSDDDEDDE